MHQGGLCRSVQSQSDSPRIELHGVDLPGVLRSWRDSEEYERGRGSTATPALAFSSCGPVLLRHRHGPWRPGHLVTKNL